MKISYSSECRGCASKKLTRIYSHTKYPLFDDLVNEKKSGKEYVDKLDIHICNECGLLQNLKNINFEEYDYLFNILSEEKFRIDISSTELRRLR